MSRFLGSWVRLYWSQPPCPRSPVYSVTRHPTPVPPLPCPRTTPGRVGGERPLMHEY